MQDARMTTEAKPPLLTLKFGFHGNVGEASEDCYNLVILLLSQKPQHVPPVRVLQTHQVLKAPYLILGEWRNGYREINRFWENNIEIPQLKPNQLNKAWKPDQAKGNTRPRGIRVPFWRCSIWGALPRSGAAVVMGTWPPVAPVPPSESASYSSR